MGVIIVAARLKEGINIKIQSATRPSLYSYTSNVQIVKANKLICAVSLQIIFRQKVIRKSSFYIVKVRRIWSQIVFVLGSHRVRKNNRKENAFEVRWKIVEGTGGFQNWKSMHGSSIGSSFVSFYKGIKEKLWMGDDVWLLTSHSLLFHVVDSLSQCGIYVVCPLLSSQ